MVKLRTADILQLSKAQVSEITVKQDSSCVYNQ